MIRTIFWLFFAAMAFLTGYYFGEQRTFHIPDHLRGLPSEISYSAAHLEHTLKGVRLWMALNDSRDHLNLASLALDDKNFGNAVHEVKEARAKLEKAEGLSHGELKRELKPLNKLITETEVSVIQLNPKARTQMESARKALDKIISK